MYRYTDDPETPNRLFIGLHRDLGVPSYLRKPIGYIIKHILRNLSTITFCIL